MLKIIEKGAAGEFKPAPLLFVHGASHSAWCWDEHLLDCFANKGYHALAISLRGHGGSPTTKPLNSCAIADYVADVASVVDQLPAAPILIGHSMGGFVVQKYLEARSTPGAVLMSPAPPRTFYRIALRGLVDHPWLSTKVNVTRNSLHLYPNSDAVRQTLFCAHTPEDVVEQCYSRLEPESYRALCQDLVFADLVHPERVTTPLLILEGADVSWGRKPAIATGRAYRTEPEFFAYMGHNMMLEPGWPAVAERIECWINALAR